MGVTQLWQILAPVQQHKPLSSLSGLTLAVDLSIWVCETQCVKQMQGVVSKPFLRNLFFRISHLTQLGVKLVFVVEGKAPELKWEAMMKRQQVRFPGRQGRQTQHRQGRRNFNSCLRECCELLDILGIPYVQSQGEAEAMCAVLNAAGLVDGCLTNDGDAFLYGATVVYRNFTMNTKDPHVECYKMSDIHTELGIDRDGLVALALLLGCDYIPKGVPGVGPANAVKLLQTLRGRNVLKRLREWKTMSESQCLDQVEVLMRRKAVNVSNFPQEKVIKEFLVSKDKCPRVLPSWKRPIINRLQDFALDKLEWPVEYGLEKILPLVTLWDMTDITQSKNSSRSLHLKPHRIVKSRVRHGVPCYEIEWNKPVSDTTCPDDYYTTIEEQDLFIQCYPHVVDEFNVTQEEKKTKKSSKGTNKKKKDDQKLQTTNEVEPLVPVVASSCPIADELTDSFASLKVDDIMAETDNTNSGKAGTDQLKTKNPKKGKRRKTGKDKIYESKADIKEPVEKPCLGAALDGEAYETNIEVKNNFNIFNKDDHLVSENDAEEMDVSNNDSFVPLSLRVKKKLEEKNVVDKLDMLVSALNQNSKVEIDNAADGCVGHKVGKECVSMTKTENYPSFNDSYAYSINLDNIDTPGKLCDVSDDEYKNLIDSVLGSKGDLENVERERQISHTPKASVNVENVERERQISHTPKASVNVENVERERQISHTPKASVNECNSDTPLSLQKQFANDRFNTKISSPLDTNFSSPVTYIKQTSNNDDKSHSFIEILDTPDIRKPEILINDNTEQKNTDMCGNFENADKMEISEMKDSPSGDLGTDVKMTLEGRSLDFVNRLVTTPLYSVNRCAQSTSHTVASPLHILCQSKLNISEMSLLDKPDFNIQTSLLNSLCKTLNISSSPANLSHDQKLVNNSDASFEDNASITKNGLETGLEDFGDNLKKVNDNVSPLRNGTGVLMDSFAKPTIHETILIEKQIGSTFESKETRTNVTKTCFSSLGKETDDTDVKLNNDSHNAISRDIGANSERIIYGTKFTDRLVFEDITNKKISENNENGIEEVRASQKEKRRKGNRKKKKKEVKKVSAFMDLSHDSDDSFILSQLSQKGMISSQKQMVSSQLQMISSQKKVLCDEAEPRTASFQEMICENLCGEATPIDEAEKENIETLSQSVRLRGIESGKSVREAKRKSDRVGQECTTELIATTNSKVVSSRTKSSRTSSFNEVDPVNSGLSMNESLMLDITLDKLNNNCEAEKDRFKTIDETSDRFDATLEKAETPVFDVNCPVKFVQMHTKIHGALNTTVAAASPVSLADRLRKRLKNSSMRQVLTDFTT